MQFTEVVREEDVFVAIYNSTRRTRARLNKAARAHMQGTAYRLRLASDGKTFALCPCPRGVVRPAMDGTFSARLLAGFKPGIYALIGRNGEGDEQWYVFSLTEKD